MFEVDNKFSNANISCTVRFTEPLYEKLKKVSTEKDVSFNLLILQCCSYALDNMKEA